MFNPTEHMMKLKGKDYLQVAWRLVWFRDADNGHPLWGLSTEVVDRGEDWAVFKATITDEDGRVLSTGHGSESKRDFGDFLEKAETKAVGRALAMLGFGTQFADDELEEGERIVDSPVAKFNCADCGIGLTPYKKRDGSVWEVPEIADYSRRRFDRVLCPACQRKAMKDADS